MAVTTQVVYSDGIFHGLPTYPSSPELTGLTALVTGANGISGYHMVKVLAAAPQRWKRIFCLSRRPPPDYFFEELGEGAARVQHVSADFLTEPSEIADSMRESISQVDYVFFFSYMQPPQKGKILSMWSNADELTKVNSTLLSNFLNGLRLANLKPKRFLLQTGAKHYGFHMGPALSPSFESDPRVMLESNFYYSQEDTLVEYCQKQGVQWNVVRPSYIIGAVRDSALNHMIGLAFYGAVQAHLKQPLAFPGDLTAWDREHCQSTAILNSYMEEWAVLSPNAANEAFNMQDGLPFTWGRFWPYLAEWYGTSWSAPEVDESKYVINESRHKKTPRGYGPPGATRSTFSLMEWSHKPEVEQAWQELTSQHTLVLDPFKDRSQVFGQTDSAVIGGWPLSLSMSKARKLGFMGTVDSYEAAFHVIGDLARLKLAAPMVTGEFKP